MVKGTNRRVVVVKSPDPNMFEEAIFILKEAGSSGGKENSILKEAEKVANEYLSGISCSSKRFLQRIPPLAFALFGAFLTGAVWLILHILGI